MATASQVPKVALADANGDIYTASGSTGGLSNAELRASAVPVDTELPAAAALAGGTTTPTVPAVGSFIMVQRTAGGAWYPAVADFDSGDGLGASVVVPRTIAEGYIYNGVSWDRTRTPTIFKPQSAVAIGSETAIWTPAASKKFRLMGGALSLSAAASITLKDNTAGTTIFITPTLEAGVPYNLPVFGNGILSGAVNRVLTATSSAAANLTGTVWGTEEA